MTREGYIKEVTLGSGFTLSEDKVVTCDNLEETGDFWRMVGVRAHHRQG